MLIYEICFSVYDLTSLLMTVSKSAYTSERGTIPFYGWVIFHLHTCPIFVHSSVDRPLGGFRTLAVVNGAAVNTRVHVSFQLMVLNLENTFKRHFLSFHYWWVLNLCKFKCVTDCEIAYLRIFSSLSFLDFFLQNILRWLCLTLYIKI